MSLWIYFHFPSLQLNALHADGPARSIVIVEGRKNEIVQCNAQAREEGIRLGMGLATAASLCRDVQVIEYNANVEHEKLTELAHWLYVVTADISLFEPNGILLRASNMLTLYDGLGNYWQALTMQLNGLPYAYSFASGYSPFAARILARKRFNQISDTQSLLLQALNSCALSDTDLSPKHIAKLARVGINKIADLLKIPMADVAKRFDVEVVNYVGRLTGKFHHSIDFYHPPEQFRRSLDLLFEVSNLNLLEKPLLKLLAFLEAFLKIRDQYAYELEVNMHLRDGQRYSLSIASASGEYKPEAWLRLCQLKFESVTLNSPVVSIELGLVRAAPKQGEMADLFEGKQGRLSSLELLSQLQAKLGDKAVKGIQVTEDPRPHLSSQFCPPLSQKETSISRDQSLLRPSILLPSPKPLRERISIVQGPERVSTGWWDGRAMIRDYFIARAANGSWLWVFRTPEQKWFLHGVFS